MPVASPSGLKYEPAAVIGVVVSVLTTISAIIAGTTDVLEGSTAIFVAVASFVIPLVQAALTRQKVVPVATLQTDAQ